MSAFDIAKKYLSAIKSDSAKTAVPVVKKLKLADVMEVFPGAKVIQFPQRCRHCGTNKHARIVKRTWPDGRWDWCCHRCGREVRQ